MDKRNQKYQFKNRIFVAVALVLLLFISLTGRLFYVQIIKASEYTDKQEAYTVNALTTTAARGDIYDRNNNLLAMDANCKKIGAVLNGISDIEYTVSFLSARLGLDQQELYAMLTRTDTNYVTIKTGVDNTTAQIIEEEDLSGITITDDKKRYYTDSMFAQYILGFTGSDHDGLYGVEASYNEFLSGEDGIATVVTDVYGNTVESSLTTIKDAVDGDDLVLTIDSVMQYYAEQAVYEAYEKNSPQRVLAIVTDPETGEVLAMAAYPSYDLEEAWTPTQDFVDSRGSEFDEADLSDIQLEMWKNPFTTFLYEPGSTFKVITASSALEEDIVNLESQYYCGGYLQIADVKIKCWIYPSRHGQQDLTEAVANSCNVAMMQVAKEMGPDIFYKYIYAYGFSEETGIDLDSEENGILAPNSELNLVDYLTLSFGQGIGVTPIQMIQALNAAINGGELLKPHVVKSIIDSENGDVITEVEKEVIRQVISEDTSQKMQDILKYTADNYSSISNYRDVGMGGKTGTAQKYINGRYARGLYVSSFYCFAPYDDPEVSVIVLVDEPGGYLTTGSSVAAPIGSEILKNCINYLNSTSQSGEIQQANQDVIIPDLRGSTLEQAKVILENMGIEYTLKGDGNGIIINQTDRHRIYQEGTSVVLRVEDGEGNDVVMPDLYGMTVIKASELIDQIGLDIDISGSGVVNSQSVKKGTVVTKGTKIKVTFSLAE